MFRLTRNFFIVALLILLPFFSVQSAHFSEEVSGYILLQVEKNGEAWYVYPPTGERYSLGRPAQAFEVIQKLSLGATHEFITQTDIFPERLAGRILLDVEQNGEAYYIYPKDLKKYYLNRPADAFDIMRNLGLGITNKDLAYIPIGDINQDESEQIIGKVLIDDVPFTPQAPFGDWSDQRQQDGCEESSALMAIRWARGEDLSYQEALEEIIGASDYILDKYGEYRDVSVTDTIDWIIKDYFSYENVFLKENISEKDMIDELDKGNLLLIPMNGQLMHNPYFTAPGPPRHMVVVRGYDAEKEVFITNDPGTRYGELYEYDYETFYKAIRDYPTGYHELIDEIKKDMIVVYK
jgi:hypothetical protein